MPAGHAESEAAAGAAVHAHHEGRGRPRREHQLLDDLIQEVGAEAANAVRLRSLALYKYAASYARERGIIIADTKFEFGLLDGEPIVIDEMLTPDSSAASGRPTSTSPGALSSSFDKQFVRDWLNALRLEPRAAGAGAAGRHRREDGGPLPRGVQAPDRPRGRALLTLSPELTRNSRIGDQIFSALSGVRKI